MAHTQRLYDHKCIGKHTKHRILASYKTNQSDTCTHLCSAKQKSDAMRKSFVKHNYKVSVSNKQQHHIHLKMVKSTDNHSTRINSQINRQSTDKQQHHCTSTSQLKMSSGHLRF
eukprot:140938_1